MTLKWQILAYFHLHPFLFTPCWQDNPKFYQCSFTVCRGTSRTRTGVACTQVPGQGQILATRIWGGVWNSVSKKLLTCELPNFDKQSYREHLVLILCLTFCSFPWKGVLFSSQLKWNISGHLLFLPSLCEHSLNVLQMPKWFLQLGVLGQYLRVLKSWSYPTRLSNTAFDSHF